MKIIYKIALRDFKAIVFSPLFLFLLGLVSCLWSYNFPRQFIAFSMMSASQSMNIHFSLFVQHFTSLLFILMVLIPLVTMRLIAEEKKQRTYDLLLTSPITSSQISIGKYFGGLLAVAVFILVAFTYPLMTLMFTDFHYGSLLTTLLGLLLMSSLFVGVGLFSSSLTDSVMISVITGFMLNFMIWVVGQGAIDMSDNGFLVSVAQQFSASYHFSAFMYGKLSVGSILFFVSATVFFVFLSQKMIDYSRWRS